MHSDSPSILHIGQSLVFYEKINNFEVDCHFVNNKRRTNIIYPLYLPTTIQLPNIFKGLLEKEKYNLSLIFTN